MKQSSHQSFLKNDNFSVLRKILGSFCLILANFISFLQNFGHFCSSNVRFMLDNRFQLFFTWFFLFSLCTVIGGGMAICFFDSFVNLQLMQSRAQPGTPDPQSRNLIKVLRHMFFFSTGLVKSYFTTRNFFFFDNFSENYHQKT